MTRAGAFFPVMTPPATNPEADEQLISLPAAASRLDISLRGFYRLIAQGDLPPPVKVGRSSKMFQSDLSGYVQKLKAQRV
jgi:predicted DNA-binding transcriptional regulator AlpA